MKRPLGEFDLLCPPFVVSFERQLSERFFLVSFRGRVISVLKKLPLNESFGGFENDKSSCTHANEQKIKEYLRKEFCRTYSQFTTSGIQTDKYYNQYELANISS